MVSPGLSLIKLILLLRPNVALFDWGTIGSYAIAMLYATFSG